MSHNAISIAPMAELRIGRRAQLVAEHVLPQALDAEGGLAHRHALGELMDRRFHRPRLELAGAFAHALDAVVREHVGEHPVGPLGADHVSIDAGDTAVAALAHRRAPFSPCPVTVARMQAEGRNPG
jgi:hypothetical protein